jgi:hypothetical protein
MFYSSGAGVQFYHIVLARLLHFLMVFSEAGFNI